MATKCFAPVLGKRIRVTKLTDCGGLFPTATPNVVLATDGFVSVKLSSEIEDGAEILTKKANGAFCVNEKFADSFKRFTLEIEFCGVNPALLSMVANASAYYNYCGDLAGFTIPEGLIDNKFSLELWTGLSGAPCPTGTSEASGYMLLPYVNAGAIGDIEINGEDAVSFTMTGAYTKGGNSWGVGPFNVVAACTGATGEVQSIAITGTPTGGSFNLTFRGETTAAIPYNATAAQVDAALEALSTIGSVTTSGGPLPGTAVSVTFVNPTGDVQQLTASSSLTGGTTPAVNITTTTPGVNGTATGAASPLPIALDPLDHLLLMDTTIAPPPSACDPVAMP